MLKLFIINAWTRVSDATTHVTLNTINGYSTYHSTGTARLNLVENSLHSRLNQWYVCT